MNPWTTHASQYEEELSRVSEIAKEKELRLNPDEERVMKVVGLMTNNFVDTGKHICPCKQSRPINPAKDVTCPCPSWEDEIGRDGHCFCCLFFAKPSETQEECFCEL